MSKALNSALFVSLAGLPLAALAHGGHAGGGFGAGFAHPFVGVDHLLAMLVVGAWSVLHMQRVWRAPLLFVALLALGALLGQQGVVVAQGEPLLAVSVLVLGLMLARRLEFAAPLALTLIGGFALVHGYAHGAELAAGRGVLAGIVAGSTLLHVAGMLGARRLLHDRPRLAARCGQIVAVLGGGLVFASVLA